MSENKKKNSRSRDDFWNQTEIFERGWTKSGVAKFLGEPDEERTNPHYKKAAPVKLFLRSRVTAIEETSAFNDWLAKSAKRKQSAIIAVNTKSDRLVGELETFHPAIPNLSRDELERKAYSSWLCFKQEKAREFGNPPFIDEGDFDEEFMARISVNYLRHHKHVYDKKIRKVEGKIGSYRFREMIRGKIFHAISEKYPWLAEECDRQQSERVFEELDRRCG